MQRSVKTKHRSHLHPIGMRQKGEKMPNTYTQIHIHTVFAVQNRLCPIDKSWRDRLYQYIVSIIQNNGHKVLAIGGVSDHVHILFGFRPTESLSHLMQEVKRDSSAWINANHFVKGIEFIYLDDRDVVRHKLVTDIINAYKKHHEEEEKEENLEDTQSIP